MAEGRPLHGDGMENLQDYVEERLTYGSDSDEYADANRELQRQMADLKALQQEREGSAARPNIDALIEEAQLDLQRARLSGTERAVGGGDMPSDPRVLPPQNEARNRINSDLNDQSG